MIHPIIDTASLGKVALFYQQNALRFGYITHIEANKLHLSDTEGASYALSAARLLLYSYEYRAHNPAELHAFKEQAWELSKGLQPLPLTGDTFSDICQNYQIETDLARFALYLHLKHQPLLYQQKHERFYRLSEAEAEKLQTWQLAQKERQEWLERVRDYATGILELSKADSLLLRQELRLYLQGQKIEDLEKVLKSLAASGATEQIAIGLRRRLGESSPDPMMEASGLPIIFEREYPLKAETPEALPLAEHTAFCIDDEDSLDFDDAISLQALEGGYRLGIHISLLALQIEAHSALFEEALNRVSSLYLPPETVPMLPPVYSQERFSLKSGRILPVLSQYFYLDFSYNTCMHEIKLERIEIARNFSYNEIARLTAESPFDSLIQIAGMLKEKRDNWDEKMPYYQVFVKDGKVKMRRIDPQSAGRALIEELMILYNTTIAESCARQNLPLIYRNINHFYDANQQFANSTAYLATTAEYHPGIGAGAYLHASSPIRRVVDLINQMQIVSHLQTNGLCFTESELQKMIPVIEKRILQIREILQQSERYWFLKYIEQNELNSPLKAWHRGYVNGKIKAEILPWGKTALLISEAMPQAESFMMIIYKVDWEKGCLVGDLIE